MQWVGLLAACMGLAATMAACAASSDSQPTLQIGGVGGTTGDSALGEPDAGAADAPTSADATTPDDAIQPVDANQLYDATGLDATGLDATGLDAGELDAAPVVDVVADSEDAVAPPDAPQADEAVADLPPPPDVPLPDVPPPDVPPPDVPPPDVPPPDVPKVDSGVAVDTGPPAPICGDGVCQGPTETGSSCPSDCSTGWLGCASAKCQATASACGKSPSCATATNCATNCKDLGCLSACTTTMDWTTLVGLLQPLATCAQQQGCLSPAPPSPSAGPSSCKNGTCDSTETHLTCPSDCPFPISASELCQTQKCAASYASCVADKACVDAAVCWNQKFDPQQCLPNNQAGKELTLLINCIQSYCSNSAPAQSCFNNCGNFSQGAACQCDAKCKQFNDCCPDFGAFCGG